MDLMPYVDFMYVVFLRYISSLQGYRFKVQFSCPSSQCGGQGREAVVDALDLEFDDLRLPSLPVYVTVMGEDLAFSLLTLRRWERLWRLQQKDGEALDPVVLVAHLVQGRDPEQVVPLIRDCSVDEGQVLSYVDRELALGLRPLQVQCPKCHQTVQVEMEVGVAIRPFRPDGESPGNRIRFKPRTTGGIGGTETHTHRAPRNGHGRGPMVSEQVERVAAAPTRTTTTATPRIRRKGRS